MLDIGKEEATKAKCYFTHSTLPQYIDDSQPPTKRKPFSSILAQPYSHSLDVLVPQAGAGKLQNAIEKAAGTLEYTRVEMKLKDILEGDFFNHYVKSGNILLISQGRAGLDNTFRLVEGVLHIELDRATYERAGLVGQPIQGPGRKHQKSRFAIDINLRLPNMVSGKKGFERLRHASETVFTTPLTWLFHDLRPSNPNDPINTFTPTLRTINHTPHTLPQISIPSFPSTIEDEIEATESLEWITLACLDSPRIHKDDNIDSLLCRYEVPGEEIQTGDLVRLSWHGLLPAVYVGKVFTAAVKTSSEMWFAMKVSGFDGRACTVLKAGDGKAMTWECE